MPAVFETLSSTLFRNTWTLTGSASVGDAWQPPCSLAVSSVQIVGDFGDSSVSLEVSNNGEDWVPLNDKNEVEISATSPSMYDISSAAAFVRARLFNGSSESVQVSLVAWAAL